MLRTESRYVGSSLSFHALPGCACNPSPDKMRVVTANKKVLCLMVIIDFNYVVIVDVDSIFPRRLNGSNRQVDSLSGEFHFKDFSRKEVSPSSV